MEFITTKSFEVAIYPHWDKNASRLALVLPGKLDSWQYRNLVSHAELLSQMWFYAMSFDPPGTWNSPWDSDKLYTTSNYLLAVEEIINYFWDRETFVAGKSRWWTLAILAWTRLEQVTWFASIVWWYTLNPELKNNYPNEKRKNKWYTTKRNSPPGIWPRDIELSLPYSFLEDEIQYHIEKDLPACTKPKMFIAWLQDTLVTPGFIKQWFELSAWPKRYHEIDFHHDYRESLEMINQVNWYIEEFVWDFY